MPHLRSYCPLGAVVGLAFTALLSVLGASTARASDVPAQALTSRRVEAPSRPVYYAPPPPPAIRSAYRPPHDRDDYNDNYRRDDHHHHHHHRDRNDDYRGSYRSDGSIPARR